MFKYLTFERLNSIHLLRMGLAIMLVSYHFNSFGQEITLPTVLPPSPQSHALIQYNSPDVGLNTGTLQLSIPLFNIQDRDFNLPINLKYSTNGVKVDEAASRVGISWVLNSGGVIIRSVNNRPDERATRLYPPNDGTAIDGPLLTYLQNVTKLTMYDTEPDEFNFNFNGYSGKFILDGNKHPVCIPYSGLKIDYTDGLTPFISITTPDGSIYQFDAIEYSNIVSFCYGDNNSMTGSPIPTSWYLTSVITKLGVQCNFTYEDVSYQYTTGVNQSAERSDDLYNQQQGRESTDHCGNNINLFCFSMVFLAAKRITNITCGTTSASFYYQNRQDLPGDKLISSIELKSNGNLIDKFNFDYTTSTASTAGENPQVLIDTSLVHRPFLSKIHHLGNGGSPEQLYQLSYNDIQALPQRSSFSQDYFGYANGKHNFNFLPLPADSLMLHLFQANATADRSPDSVYAAKGVLKKIQYPTGGSDNFYYKGNDYPKIVTTPPGKTTLLNNLTSSGTVPLTRSSPSFQILYNYPDFVKLSAGMLILTDPNSKYKADGPKTLIDKELGGGNFGNGKWVGSQSDMAVLMWFNEPTEVHTLNLSVMRNVGSQIFLPATVEVWGGADQNHLRLLSTVNTATPLKDDPFALLSLECKLKVTASISCIKLVAKPLKTAPAWHPAKSKPGWVFMDEVFIN